MKTAGNNPSAGIVGTATRIVSNGGYVGALANKFHVGYKRKGEQVTVAWDADTVTLIEAHGTTIAQYPKPDDRHGWHGPHRTPPFTKS